MDPSTAATTLGVAGRSFARLHWCVSLGPAATVQHARETLLALEVRELRASHATAAPRPATATVIAVVLASSAARAAESSDTVSSCAGDMDV